MYIKTYRYFFKSGVRRIFNFKKSNDQVKKLEEKYGELVRFYKRYEII